MANYNADWVFTGESVVQERELKRRLPVRLKDAACQPPHPENLPHEALLIY
jgi:hypothetical protein